MNSCSFVDALDAATTSCCPFLFLQSMLLDATLHCDGVLCSNGRHFMPLGTLVSGQDRDNLQVSDAWIPIRVTDGIVQEKFGSRISTLLAADAITMSYKAPTSSQHIYFRVYIGTTPNSIQYFPKKSSGKSVQVRESWEALLQTISRNSAHWDARESTDESMQWPFRDVSIWST
jgi:hypothetical protein